MGELGTEWLKCALVYPSLFKINIYCQQVNYYISQHQISAHGSFPPLLPVNTCRSNLFWGGGRGSWLCLWNVQGAESLVSVVRTAINILRQTPSALLMVRWALRPELWKQDCCLSTSLQARASVYNVRKNSSLQRKKKLFFFHADHESSALICFFTELF